MKKLSIITVVYNDNAGFIKTAHSVFEQRKFFPNIEYIVVDGGSLDGTADSVRELSGSIDHWVSERDKGIYDAMNKGIALATGDGLLFLNAGDYFVGDVLSGCVAAPAFLRVKYVDILKRFRDRPIVSHKSGISNCHQGIIFENKSILYDTSFDICADYKYFLDHGYDVNVPLVQSSGHVFFDAVGVSAQKIHQRDHQIYVIRQAYFGKVTAIVYEAFPFLKRVIRKILRK